MKAKSPKVVDRKLNEIKKVDSVDRKLAMSYNLVVIPRSLQSDGENACRKKSVETAIQSAKGSRLASIGRLSLQFSNEQDAKAAMEATQKLNSTSVAIKVTTDSESYERTKRCLHVGKHADMELVVKDVKTVFKTAHVKAVKRFNTFAGLLMLSFDSIELAKEADEVCFRYGDEVKRCRPWLKYPQQNLVGDSDQPSAKIQHYSVHVTLESLLRGKKEHMGLCLKDSVFNVIKAARGGRLAATGAMTFQFLDEKLAQDSFKAIEDAGFKIAMSINIHEPCRRLVYIGRKVDVAGYQDVMKNKFQAATAEELFDKRQNFTGLSILTFADAQTAAAADIIDFSYDGKNRGLKPYARMQEILAAKPERDMKIKKKEAGLKRKSKVMEE